METTIMGYIGIIGIYSAMKASRLRFQGFGFSI